MYAYLWLVRVSVVSEWQSVTWEGYLTAQNINLVFSSCFSRSEELRLPSTFCTSSHLNVILQTHDAVGMPSSAMLAGNWLGIMKVKMVSRSCPRHVLAWILFRVRLTQLGREGEAKLSSPMYLSAMVLVLGIFCGSK